MKDILRDVFLPLNEYIEEDDCIWNYNLYQQNM